MRSLEPVPFSLRDPGPCLSNKKIFLVSCFSVPPLDPGPLVGTRPGFRNRYHSCWTVDGVLIYPETARHLFLVLTAPPSGADDGPQYVSVRSTYSPPSTLSRPRATRRPWTPPFPGTGEGTPDRKGGPGEKEGTDGRRPRPYVGPPTSRRHLPFPCQGGPRVTWAERGEEETGSLEVPSRPRPSTLLPYLGLGAVQTGTCRLDYWKLPGETEEKPLILFLPVSRVE